MVTNFGSPSAGSVSAGEEWLSMPPWVSLAHSWPQLARSMATSVLLESVCRYAVLDPGWRTAVLWNWPQLVAALKPPSRSPLLASRHWILFQFW